MHFVGGTSTSWNACAPMAVSTTGAASAAVSVRPHCGQVTMDSIQEMVSRPRRPQEELWAWPGVSEEIGRWKGTGVLGRRWKQAEHIFL